MSASWFADKIEQWPTAKLLPYIRNARTHSEAQIAQIAASIAESVSYTHLTLPTNREV